MFDAPYRIIDLGGENTGIKDPYYKKYYKFEAKHRTYFVTLELYSFQMVAIKYCDLADKASRNAYHKIFNDGDASKVIGTCFHVMLHYWQKNKNVNFVFYACLRNITDELLHTKSISEAEVPTFIEQYKRARYIIYRYGMVNLFSFNDFTQLSDKDNCIYVLMNKDQKQPGLIISKLKLFLQENHQILFTPE